MWVFSASWNIKKLSLQVTNLKLKIESFASG